MCDAAAVGDQAILLMDLIRAENSRVTSPEDRMYLEAAQALVDPLVPFDDPVPKSTLTGEKVASVSNAEQNNAITKKGAMNMKPCAVKGKEVIATNDENNALPHAVPARTSGEKAPGSEPAQVKKGSIGERPSHCGACCRAGFTSGRCQA